MKHLYKNHLGITPALLWVAATIVIPVCVILAYSFSTPMPGGQVGFGLHLDAWRDVFSDFFYFSIMLSTIRLAAVSTLLCILIGFAPAYLLTMLGPKQRTILLAMLFLPSWISYIVKSMSWIEVLGRNGVLNNLLIRFNIIDQPLQIIYNDYSIYIGLVHWLMPFMIINIYISLSKIDNNVVLAARSLGANGFWTFFTTILPLSFKGVAAGSLLCFMLAMGAYVTPMILGGPGSVYFGNLIYETLIFQQEWALAAALAVCFMVIMGILLTIYTRLVGGQFSGSRI